MKSLLCIFYSLFFYTGLHAQYEGLIDNQRSDTIDVLDYKINMDFTGIASQHIEASTRVKFEVQFNNVNSISLDLQELTIDSVKQGNASITFSYNDTLLVANFLSPLNQNDIDSVTVYYSGTPVTDNSGLGGFYFLGNSAFNFGVGFEAKPHNFGRVWHPCFDNFVERATYDITLITPATLSGYSVGLIANEFIDGSGNNVRRWIMNDPVPSYLSGVAVSNYTHVSDTYNSPVTNDDIPIMLIAEASDTASIKASFANLKNALEIYENRYGPYEWDKVGYIFVPFSSAAMEHATAVVYPAAIATGNLQFEYIMVHELSHHWWGDLTNCKVAEDMWINESFATFSEALFFEDFYGETDYIEDLKSKHAEAIQEAHYNDGAYYPLSGIPHEATYGTHTYQKGATIVHNLRTYLGDNLFFSGLQALLNNNQFSALDAGEFKDELATATGVNLDDFFNGWIMNSGYPGFNIDSLQVMPSGNDFSVEVFVRQRLHQAPNYFDGVPMEVTFIDTDMNEHSGMITINGMSSSETVTIPFEPVAAYLNKNHGIFNAVTGKTDVIKTTGLKLFDYAYARLQVNTINSDSALVRIEHHRTAPEPFENPALAYQFAQSTERFWRIDGVWNNDFDASAEVFFDGRNLANGNLDSALLKDYGNVTFHEDSVLILYRPGAGFEWSVYEDYEVNSLGSPTNKFGRVIINSVKKGEYCFGVRKNLASVNDPDQANNYRIYPNPSYGVFYISLYSNISESAKIKVYNNSGRFIHSQHTEESDFKVDLKKWPSGVYTLNINIGEEVVREQLIIAK